MKQTINVFWFRRDLRITDNAGLLKALTSGLPVLCMFIFDTEILQKLEDKDDARVTFIYSRVNKLKQELENQGSSLKVYHSSPLEAFAKLAGEFNIQKVFANKDYEPETIRRDEKVSHFLEKRGIGFMLLKDHVIFEEKEIAKDNGEPYTVFTPYSRKWKQKLKEQGLEFFPSEKHLAELFRTEPFGLPSLTEIGFVKSNILVPEPDISPAKLKAYAETRNFPALNGTTGLGPHLRFGMVSVREVVKIAEKISETFLNELIWRDFFISILSNFPQVVHQSFKPKYDFIRWRNNEEEFEKWCRGETGYPMVDAGMRELNRTGIMHNRVRMIAASFLVKHLLIDWRWGEHYFARNLLDFELASNNGNWQWAAGCGCDAAPYFRVFNPETQQKKFDPNLQYIRKWIPEFGTTDYPEPVVEHTFARQRAIDTFKKALNG